MVMALGTRSFGKTGIRVSAIGLGAGRIGDPGQSEDHVAALRQAFRVRGAGWAGVV
ncbi:MAG: hypothetical protein OHK0013_41530 [Sandaracinaceae bacterium]